MLELHLIGPAASERTADGFADKIVIAQFPWVLGRAGACHPCFLVPVVSRQHCAFSLRDGQLFVEDLGSRNGTFLNAAPVTGPRPVHNGDRLDLAHLAFEVRLTGALLEGDQGPEIAPSVAPRQVLVVDDDKGLAETMALLLEGWGLKVRVAHDGPEALREARACPPDTVFMDIHMPGMDGHEVARRMRTEAALSGARLVAVTGDRTQGADQAPREGAFDCLLLKPVGPEVLREVLGQSG